MNLILGAIAALLVAVGVISKSDHPMIELVVYSCSADTSNGGSGGCGETVLNKREESGEHKPVPERKLARQKKEVSNEVTKKKK
jgi:hypothetical protein